MCPYYRDQNHNLSTNSERSQTPTTWQTRFE